MLESQGADLKETLQEAQEHQLSLVLERRKAAEEKADSRKATEALQQVRFLLGFFCVVFWLACYHYMCSLILSLAV